MEREIIRIKHWVYISQNKANERVVTTGQISLLLVMVCSSAMNNPNVVNVPTVNHKQQGWSQMTGTQNVSELHPETMIELEEIDSN